MTRDGIKAIHPLIEQLPDFYQVILHLSENNVGKVMTIKRGELHEYCRNDG